MDRRKIVKRGQLRIDVHITQVIQVERTQLTPQQVGESQLVVLVVLGGIKTEEVELGLKEGLGVEGG